MDSAQNRPRPMSVEEAKQQLLEETTAGSPMGLIGEPMDWIRRHPKEAMLFAAGAGLLLGAMPKIRKTLLTTGIDVARMLMR